MSTPKWVLTHEQLILVTRPHGRVLLGPAAAAVLLAGLLGTASAWLYGVRWPVDWAMWVPLVWLVLAGASVSAVFVWSLLPYLRWLGTRYTLTTHRLVTRSGILGRRQREVVLRSVRSVQVRQGLFSRLLGVGDLLVMCSDDVGLEAVVPVRDVPQVAAVKNEIVRQLDQRPAMSPYSSERLAHPSAQRMAASAGDGSRSSGVLPGGGPFDR